MPCKHVKRGPRTVTSEDEAKVFNDRLILATQRGFPVDEQSFRFVLGNIASEGRRGWHDMKPADDAVRSYLARI